MLKTYKLIEETKFFGRNKFKIYKMMKSLETGFVSKIRIHG